MSEYTEHIYQEYHGKTYEPINQREEIVRCRDCRCYVFKDRSGIFHDDRHNDSYCRRFVSGGLMEVEPDGFCAWGNGGKHDRHEPGEGAPRRARIRVGNSDLLVMGGDCMINALSHFMTFCAGGLVGILAFCLIYNSRP